MSNMRLIVAGAGGRMGRTVVRAIAETDGMVLTGALETKDSAVTGRDAGELAGLGANGILVTTDPDPLLNNADGKREKRRRIEKEGAERSGETPNMSGII